MSWKGTHRESALGPPNVSAHEPPRNQLKSRSEATSKGDLRGRLHALVGRTLRILASKTRYLRLRLGLTEDTTARRCSRSSTD